VIETTTGTRWVSVARLGDVTRDTVTAARCGSQVVALVNVDGTISALENTCPHRGGPLAGGRLVDGEIACPWHGFRFDPRTGSATMPTPHPAARTLPIRIVGDDVQVGLADDSAETQPDRHVQK
jgi:nitrite reductase/ring-hydroxylating ferredoxin subunit